MNDFMRIYLGLLALSLLMAASCTDRRPNFLSNNFPQPTQAPPLQLIADVQYMGQPTEALQMTIADNSLYLTGKPYAFARWEIASNPESPRLMFAAATNITAFSSYPQFGYWTVDNFAQGALDIVGRIGIMSGAAGASMIDMSQYSNPVEIRRYPPDKVNGNQVTRDPNFVYSAFIHHPTLPVAYGFAQVDFVYTLSLDSTGITIKEKAAYAQQSVCCAMGAAISGDRVLVAMRGSLWTFNIDKSGMLQNGIPMEDLQAVNIVTTANYIYVQHSPTNTRTSGQVRPAGIYIFNLQGQSISMLPISPIRFAVFNDQYLYANIDNTRVSIFALTW